MTTKDLIVSWYQNKFNESSGKLNQAGHNAISDNNDNIRMIYCVQWVTHDSWLLIYILSITITIVPLSLRVY